MADFSLGGNFMMTQEKIQHYVDTLKQRHHLLEEQIEEEYKNYSRDEVVEKLKKEKLLIKDKITSFEKDIH